MSRRIGVSQSLSKNVRVVRATWGCDAPITPHEHLNVGMCQELRARERPLLRDGAFTADLVVHLPGHYTQSLKPMIIGSQAYVFAGKGMLQVRWARRSANHARLTNL